MIFSGLLVTLVAPFAPLAVGAPQGSAAEILASIPTSSAQDGKKIKFNFDREEWDFVIPWFADQAGFSLQPISQWPEGTFFLKDDSEYTPMEALDQLNHALRMRNPPFTLIRNRNMLILAPLADAQFPNDLIETVRVDQLNDRGRYETIICIFEVGEDLDIDMIFEEFRPLVSDSNRTFFAKFPAANQIRVRETGGALRIMRDILDAAKKKSVSDNKRTATYFLRHTDPETFMLMARGQLDMDPGRDFSRDNSITITREPFGKRLFVRATEKMHKRFDEVAAVIDVPPEQDASVEVKQRSFRQYGILVDPEMGYGMVEMVLEGRGARMHQDKITSAITVFGTDDDHKLVSEALEALTQSGGQEFAIIPLTFGEASQILTALMNLMRLSAFENNPEAPVVFADSEKNSVVVRGKPKDVAEIKKMVAELDLNAKSDLNRSRSDTRVITVNERDIDYLPEVLEYLLQGEGRRNPIQIIKPEDRKDFRSRNRRMGAESFFPDGGPPRSDDQNQSRRNAPLDFLQAAVGYRLVGLSTRWLTYLPQPQDPPQLTGSAKLQDDDLFLYRPAEPKQSIAGAPIIAKFVEDRLILQSDDLDALDDLVAAIRRELGTKSEVSSPVWFAIQYRRANELKDVLENFFGLSTGGGDSGGGNPIANIVGNMLPMGGLFDNLFSSSGGAAASGGDLEGDVKFLVDLNKNYLFVRGATANDLDLISNYIDLLDVPNPEHEPDFLGDTKTISIRHRDPEEIKTIIEEAYPQYVEKPKAEGGGQGNNEAMQMMRMLQQIQGGGRGGGGGGQEQKPPTASLAIDRTGRKLIVTGPDYIYNKIANLVSEVDVPRTNPPSTLMYVERPRVEMETLKQLLSSRFPGQVEFEDQSTQAQNPNQAANQARQQQAQAGGQQRPGGAAGAPSQQDMQRAMSQMMQRMGGGGAGGGGQRGGAGGGGQRGGGAGGGGQRGGGGGGGGQRGGR
jgi:hypothetical protein